MVDIRILQFSAFDNGGSTCGVIASLQSDAVPSVGTKVFIFVEGAGNPSPFVVQEVHLVISPGYRPNYAVLVTPPGGVFTPSDQMVSPPMTKIEQH